MLASVSIACRANKFSQLHEQTLRAPYLLLPVFIAWFPVEVFEAVNSDTTYHQMRSYNSVAINIGKFNAESVVYVYSLRDYEVGTIVHDRFQSQNHPP